MLKCQIPDLALVMVEDGALSEYLFDNVMHSLSIFLGRGIGVERKRITDPNFVLFCLDCGLLVCEMDQIVFGTDSCRCRFCLV